MALISLEYALAWLRANRWAAWLALIVLACMIAGFLIHRHTGRAIAAHDVVIASAVASASARADDAANAGDAIRATQAAADKAANDRSIADAEASHPAAVRAAAGPATNALADRLRARSRQASAPAR